MSKETGVSSISVANSIRQRLFFATTDNFYSYHTPVTPSLIAISMFLAGDGFMQFFRVIVQLVTFFGTILLAFELMTWTRSKLLGLALLFIVAFSRPSIFWSLKLSTEATSEALLILSIALILRALRTESAVMAGAAGMVCMLLALNRPQFLPGVMAAALFFVWRQFLCWWRERRQSSSSTGTGDKDIAQGEAPPGPSRRLQVVLFLLGISIVWLPWIARNYAHYGAFIPTATSGVDTLIWEYGTVPIRAGRYERLTVGPNDDVLPTLGVGQIEGPLHNTQNDYETSLRVRQIYFAWLKANLLDYPRLFTWRLKNLIAERGAGGLTKVSREVLFPESTAGWNSPFTPKSWLDLMLVDKIPWVVFLGFGGSLLLVVRFGLPGLMVSSLVVLPWISVALIFGYPRIVESMISITIWFAAYFVHGIISHPRLRQASDLRSSPLLP